MSDLSSGGTADRARQMAEQTRSATGHAVGDVRDTAGEQARRVAGEARTQARNVVSEVRGVLGDQARSQNGRLVSGIRQTADHLDEMRGDRADSPAATVVSRVAEGGRQFADYLDRNGPEGVLREVEDFARRRPGAFLATALAAGFVVGRLGKSVAKADAPAGEQKPADTYSETPAAYTPVAPGTGYVTPDTTQYSATGTGVPAVAPVTPAAPEFRS